MSEDVELMLTAEDRRLLGVLNRNGFRRCDIAACNCGSWHVGPNLRAEKAEEVQLVQEERARELIAESEAESDSLRTELAAMKAQRDEAFRLAASLDVDCRNYGVPAPAIGCESDCHPCEVMRALLTLAKVTP